MLLCVQQDVQKFAEGKDSLVILYHTRPHPRACFNQSLHSLQPPALAIAKHILPFRNTTFLSGEKIKHILFKNHICCLIDAYNQQILWCPWHSAAPIWHTSCVSVRHEVLCYCGVHDSVIYNVICVKNSVMTCNECIPRIYTMCYIQCETSSLHNSSGIESLALSITERHAGYEAWYVSFSTLHDAGIRPVKSAFSASETDRPCTELQQCITHVPHIWDAILVYSNTALQYAEYCSVYCPGLGVLHWKRITHTRTCRRWDIPCQHNMVYAALTEWLTCSLRCFSSS